jgi:hypothetical protein
MWFALPSECGDDAVSHSVYVTRRDAPARASKQEVVDSSDGFVAHDRRQCLDFLRRKRAGRRRLEIDAANLFRPATFTGWRQRAKAALQHAERLFCHQTSGREFHARHADKALRPPIAPMIPDQGPRRQPLRPVLGCGQKTSEHTDDVLGAHAEGGNGCIEIRQESLDGLLARLRPIDAPVPWQMHGSRDQAAKSRRQEVHGLTGPA